jgi:sRNA-binding regulator protein Hfq
MRGQVFILDRFIFCVKNENLTPLFFTHAVSLGAEIWTAIEFETDLKKIRTQ